MSKKPTRAKRKELNQKALRMGDAPAPGLPQNRKVAPPPSSSSSERAGKRAPITAKGSKVPKSSTYAKARAAAEDEARDSAPVSEPEAPSRVAKQKQRDRTVFVLVGLVAVGAAVLFATQGGFGGKGAATPTMTAPLPSGPPIDTSPPTIVTAPKPAAPPLDAPPAPSPSTEATHAPEAAPRPEAAPPPEPVKPPPVEAAPPPAEPVKVAPPPEPVKPKKPKVDAPAAPPPPPPKEKPPAPPKKPAAAPKDDTYG